MCEQNAVSEGKMFSNKFLFSRYKELLENKQFHNTVIMGSANTNRRKNDSSSTTFLIYFIRKNS